MKFINEHKILIIIALIFIIMFLFVIIRYFIASNEIYTESYLKDSTYVMIPKKYGINEYSLVNITDEQMAINYLNDYKNNLYYDRETAYNSLNIEYRNARFENKSMFDIYVDNLKSSTMAIDSYRVTSCGEYKCYFIYDKGGNAYIFKVKSVMEYELYLDETTVEI